MTMTPMTWPLPQRDAPDVGPAVATSRDESIGTAANQASLAANDNAPGACFLSSGSGGLRGCAIALARPFGAVPASPPAPAGGDRGFPRLWSPPPFHHISRRVGDAS